MAGTFRLTTTGLRVCQNMTRRHICRSAPRLCDPKPVAATVNAMKSTERSEGIDLTPHHRPNNMEKRMLLLAGMYKTREEIPETVTWTQMRRAKDYFRIRVSITMVVATLFGCALMIWSGRRLRDAGDSLDKRGKEWIEEMQRKGVKEREEAAAKNK